MGKTVYTSCGTVSYNKNTGTYNVNGNTYSSKSAAVSALSSGVGAGSSSAGGSSSSSSSSGGSGSSGYNLRSCNFVDPSVLQDANNGMSAQEIANKWGGTASSVNNMLSQNEANYGTYWNGSSSAYAGSAPTLNATKSAPTLQSSSRADTGYYSYSPRSGYYERVEGVNGSYRTFKGEDEIHYGMLDTTDKVTPDNTYDWNKGKDGDDFLNTLLGNQYNAENANVDLTGGDKNTDMNKFGDFTSAINKTLQSAYGIQDLKELRQKYPDQYSTLVQSLKSVAGVWDSLDPSQRGLLDGQLQAIIGTAVGAGADTSKLNVLSESILSKFKNPDQVKQFVADVTRLQTEGMTTKDIAKQMGVSEDMVQQGILAANGLDNKLGEHFELTEDASKDITEPYDTKMERLEEEKRIALERANREVEWLTEDFNTNMERQKKANEISAHNADFISGQYGYGFSKRGIEGLNYVQDQAQQIIDDMVRNYDRANIEIADGVADILRNWERNNEDLMKASEDALTAAKNNYTSNMLAIQQQYGTVGMQAQQQMANNVQNFITQAENIYDNALARQQQNLSNLITNFSNLNALSFNNLQLRNARIQQFQQEALTMNRSQLQNLANQLGMSPEEYGDLISYQVQAVQNQLNGYVPGSGVQFQDEINSLLASGANAQEVIQRVMNQPEFQSMQSTGGDWTKLNDNTIFDKNTGKTMNIGNTSGGMTGMDGVNYVSSETIGGVTYGVSQQTMQGLQSFVSQHAIDSVGGQCGAFVNDYLQSLGLGRVFTDPIKDKKAAINTVDGYKPQVGDVVVMDSPTSPQYGHVAIITGINADGSFTTLESNRSKKDPNKVFSRTIDPNTTKVYGYYHPDGAMQGGTSGVGGEMSEYDIDTATMRIGRMAYGANISNAESERVARVLKNGSAMGKDQNQILYDVLGMKINKNYELANPFVDIMVQNSDKDGLSAYNLVGFSDFINKGEGVKAMNMVEQAVAKERGNNFSSDLAGYENGVKYAYQKGDEIIDLINKETNKLGIVAGNFNKMKTKFLKDEDFQKISAAVVNFVADWRHEMLGSATTATELKMIDDLLPSVTDNPYNAITKIQEFQDYWLRKLNGTRGNLYLPTLDKDTVLDKDKRLSLYMGTYAQGRAGGNIGAGGTMSKGKTF